jgi:DNA-binding transcriptional LysR family regulator
MDRWSEIELFVRIAELGSLRRAADALGLSAAAATRQLGSLERRIGVRLVERNTRRLFLTEAGQAYLRHCRGALAQMAEADAEVGATALDPSGTLRVTASLSFALRHIAPILPAYTERYPRVSVNVVTANRYYDLIDNNIDVAIRTREYEADSGLTVRRLAETRRLLAASPGYLDRHGTPDRLEALASHRLLIYSYANNPYELRFRRGAETRTVAVRPALEANDGQVIRAAALEGLGILVQPTYIILDDLIGGRLVPVLEDWDLPRLTMNIAYPSRQHLPAKTRSFVDFLVEHFRAMDYERKFTARYGFGATASGSSPDARSSTRITAA